jgi:uridine kinase
VWQARHVPAGLDGCPDPISTPARRAVLRRVADRIVEHVLRDDRMAVVGIDGIDGAGKSTFADELAGELRRRGVATDRASIDSFHRPRAERWAAGRTSPIGFYRDSHDLDQLHSRLLDPLTDHRPYVTGVFDEPTDRRIDIRWHDPVAGGVMVFDGIFLHRPELAGAWDLSVWLDGIARVRARRTEIALDGCPDDPALRLVHFVGWWARFDRYVTGQRIYLDEVDPASLADLVIDNNDFARPAIVSELHVPAPFTMHGL